MKLAPAEKLLLTAAAGCAAAGGWLWWSDRPALRYPERIVLAELMVHQPRGIAVDLTNDSDQPRKVIGARAY